MSVWAQDKAEQRAVSQASQLPQPFLACRSHPPWGCGQELWLSCGACEAGAVVGSVSVCTWPSPSLCRYGVYWAKLGGPGVCPGASGSLALRAPAGIASSASVSCVQVSWWAGRPPESLFLGRNTPTMPEAVGAAGRPWSSCCSPLCWATGGHAGGPLTQPTGTTSSSRPSSDMLGHLEQCL